MKTAPKNPDDFALILENAEGEKKQIYFENPTIDDSNAILEELEVFADAIEDNKPVIVPLKTEPCLGASLSDYGMLSSLNA